MSAYVSHRETPVQAASNYYYRTQQHVQAQPRVPTILRDNYERSSSIARYETAWPDRNPGWYTECTHLNRMVLSLRSGIHSDISWALERLCRLAQNERFELKDYPGLLDGLFDWPEWYINQGYKELTDDHALFSPPRDFAAHYRYALESLCVLRCAIMEQKNAIMVSEHAHTLPLILTGLENLDFTKDQNQEPLLHLLEIFQVLASNLSVSASVAEKSNPIVPLNRIISKSNNRSLIIAAFTSMNSVLSHPQNAIHLGKASDALTAAIKYLPLLVDKPLVGASLEHIYIHVSNPASARAFLLHPQLPNLLKILSSMIITEQRWTVEDVSIDLTKPQRSLPLDPRAWSNYEMPTAEFEEIRVKEEPKRCHEW
jgi:chromatin structure-remodeling complex subunit RSC9